MASSRRARRSRGEECLRRPKAEGLRNPGPLRGVGTWGWGAIGGRLGWCWLHGVRKSSGLGETTLRDGFAQARIFADRAHAVWTGWEKLEDHAITASRTEAMADLNLENPAFGFLFKKTPRLGAENAADGVSVSSTQPGPHFPPPAVNRHGGGERAVRPRAWQRLRGSYPAKPNGILASALRPSLLGLRDVDSSDKALGLKRVQGSALVSPKGPPEAFFSSRPRWRACCPAGAVLPRRPWRRR